MSMNPTVFVIDDDKFIHVQVTGLARLIEVNVQTYHTPAAFLDDYCPNQPGCMVLDFMLPGHNGLDFYRQLRSQGLCLPVIMLTGHGEITTAVTALQEGIFDYLEKPIQKNRFVCTLQRALEYDRQLRDQQRQRQLWLTRLDTLTDKEYEVLTKLLASHSNKVIARELSVSPYTINKHRRAIMRKMQVRNFIELICEVFKANLQVPACDNLASLLPPRP